jgi:hypothetical protein
MTSNEQAVIRASKLSLHDNCLLFLKYKKKISSKDLSSNIGADRSGFLRWWCVVEVVECGGGGGGGVWWWCVVGVEGEWG